MANATRQPVHTVYGGAQLFKFDTSRKLTKLAQTHYHLHAQTPGSLAAVCDIPEHLAERVHARVGAKLLHDPVADYRVDFEDGYGYRPASEEDDHARGAATEMARGHAEGTLPPSVGIRIKALGAATRARALRTLDLFCSTYAQTGQALPAPFLVTLPKVTARQQVEDAAAALAVQERRHGWRAGSLQLELMIETPEALLDPEGRVPLRPWVQASGGRCVAAHLGAYDYTAACDVTAAHQSLSHPACRFARQIMQVALAGTGVAVVDGATTAMPVPPHREASLSPSQQRENLEVVHRAWRQHAMHVRQALVEGYYQGWDLHPGQFAPRYAVVYSFFLESLPAATARLQAFLQQAAQATRVGDVFDDAASAQGLLNFFLRGLGCGALEARDLQPTGLSEAELQTRSFMHIVEGRRALPPQTKP